MEAPPRRRAPAGPSPPAESGGSPADRRSRHASSGARAKSSSSRISGNPATEAGHRTVDGPGKRRLSVSLSRPPRCPRGHPLLAPETLWIRPSPRPSGISWRVCRICNTRRVRHHKAKKALSRAEYYVEWDLPVRRERMRELERHEAAFEYARRFLPMAYSQMIRDEIEQFLEHAGHSAEDFWSRVPGGREGYRGEEEAKRVHSYQPARIPPKRRTEKGGPASDSRMGGR